MKTIFIAFSLLLSITVYSQKKPEPNLEKKAAEIHKRTLTIDSHTDTPLRFLNADFDIGKDNDKRSSKVDLPKMKAGGLDAAFFAVFLGQRERNDDANKIAIAKAHEIFAAVKKEVARYPDLAEVAYTPNDAIKLKKQGKRAIYIGIENGYAIGNDISLVKKYFEMGARYMTLCHSKNNDICDSANDTIEHNGLSKFGEDVVKEMNRVGMMIDVSHISDKSFFDVIKLSKTPVIASHSCSRTICNNPRNMTDEMLMKLKENGGVIQMCILSDYVKKIDQDTLRIQAQLALREKYKGFKNLSDEMYKKVIAEWYGIDEVYPPKLADVEDVVDHIDYIVKLIGIDHIGIGTDFDGGGGVNGCNNASEMENITLELVKRGYSEEDIQKIWSGNLLRVYRKVMEYAD
ncbi:MAG: dipeptidase [Bacteroidales bacterium]|nr:dipeptidase [Bacteroidales bacterium]